MASRQSFYVCFSQTGVLPSIQIYRKSANDAESDVRIPFLDDSDEENDDDDDESAHPTRRSKHTTQSILTNVKMVKKRTSLQSILVPYFLPPPSLSATTTKQNRMRSSSSGAEYPYHASSLDIVTPPRRNSPPPDLLDDDPFANLASPLSMRGPPSPLRSPRAGFECNRSPLSDSDSHLPSTTRPQLTRTISSGRAHARAAHQKPAFNSRPSLPSLHTLAKMNVLPKKVRRGTVGAGLPFEPWNDELEQPVASGSNTSPESQEQPSIVHSPLAKSPTSIHSPYSDFLDFSDDDDNHDELFSASPEDEDIDVGLDYTFGDNLEHPAGKSCPPALSRNNSSDLGHRHSCSTSSASSAESLGEEIFPSYHVRSLSSSPDTRLGSDEQHAADSVSFPPSPPDPLMYDTCDKDPWGCTPTPQTSMYLADPDVIEPGTSVDTITYGTVQSQRQTPIMSRELDWLTKEVVDGEDWDRRGRGPVRRDKYDDWVPNGSGRGNGEYGGSSNGGHWHNSGDGGDDRRGDKPRRTAPAYSSPSSSDESEDDSEDSAKASEDDDVPLAQRIPTALKAQRTIRLKARAERDQRRRDRTGPRNRQATLRPAGTGAPITQMMSSSQDAAIHASQSVRRPRTQTISGTASRPFAVEDLAHRLQHVHPAPGRDSPRVRSVSPEATPTPQQQQQQQARTLRPMRSFHRPEPRRMDDYQTMAMPPIPPAELPADQKLMRNNTRARSRSRADETGRARAFSAGAEPVPALPRTSLQDERATTRMVKSRTSSEQAHTQKPSPPMILSKGTLVQQRVFIGDRQRFNMVEVGPQTNAGDVIAMTEAQGSLKGWVGSGGWMLWEVAQDFGMERPVRSFELLSDIESSWNKDKMVNIFVLKLTPLASLLSRSAMPSASPVYSGYIDWEIKRGKWVKRWLTLREHSLHLAKRDNGKDEILLCSLSNFDAYFVTRLHKAPKPFVFAVKSTDNISFFEDTADYFHVFSCSKTNGDIWMERILLARSYVLFQERNVLFNPKASTNGTSAGTSLSRTATRKGAPSGRQPPQPLVNVASPDLFEPGSLLHKK